MTRSLTKILDLIRSTLSFGLVLLGSVLLIATAAQGKTKTYRKVQEVNFAELNLKGTVRNPDGAYLVQKRGITTFGCLSEGAGRLMTVMLVGTS